MNIDPLLRYLRLRGSGSWSGFTSIVESFAPDLDVRSLARGLAEHALVEFDFNAARWSACSPCLVLNAMHNGHAVSTWGGAPQQVQSGGMTVELGTRKIHTWSGSVEYSQAVRVQRPGQGWPRTWNPIDAAKIRAVIPSLDCVARRGESVASVRSGELLEFRFLSVKRAREDRPTRWVEIGWNRRRAIDSWVCGLWRRSRGDYVFTNRGRAHRYSFEIGAWLAFRNWLDANGVERGLNYDGDRGILSISAAPYLPIPYVRALMLSGARESGVIRDRIRVFHNVDHRLFRWCADLLGLNAV